ncbi:hypothetical protein [Candidatus Pelagibacter sp. Uisw_113]|uniref:hypothetical protein n=1 Tax=Candidatus Pelagibacter sp. Uisw_113 TaxID=3230994 RepID=UPI0039E9E026
MKKLLGIIVLGLLLSGNAYAGVNEPGSGPIASINDVKSEYYKNLAQVRKKNKHLITYVSISNNGGWASWSLYVKEINEKLHKKAYKKCVKAAAKYTQEDCFIFAIDDKIVWNLDGPAKPSKPKESESAESKAEQEKQAQLDKRPGRFFEDQPDVSDDYQIHFIYLLTLDGKDSELDTSGWIEKRVNRVNDKFLKFSAKNKKSNGIGQQFKLDMTKEGKLDVTFVRMNISKKQLDLPDYPNNIIYPYLRQKGFDNPKKVYATFAGFKTKHGNSDGGEGYVPMMVIYTPAVKTYGQPDMDLIILHELLHSQGAAYGCGKRTYKGTHVKGSDILGVNTVTSSLDSRNDTYYRHDIEGCPDLAKSVFVTPTAEDPWDPYDIFCRKKRGNLTHPDLYKGSLRCKGGAK